MKKLIFALTLLLTSNAFAATGSGHAQAELSRPLSVSRAQDLDFGTVAIDPTAGSQTVSVDYAGNVTCPAAYVCSGAAKGTQFLVRGALGTTVYVDISGQTATLSDGTGNTLIFDPHLFDGGPAESLSRVLTDAAMVGYGYVYFSGGGEITFTGLESAGTYSTQTAGGSGYTITVNY